jgi:hypothetical protein
MPWIDWKELLASLSPPPPGEGEDDEDTNRLAEGEP